MNGNFPEAIAIWKARSIEAADSPIREMFLAGLSASAADDLFFNTRWRALWLIEQIQSMMTAEAMLDPAVSLGMLRLDTQLALASSDDMEVTSIRESFNAHLAGIAPRSWFHALGQRLLTAATKTGATEKEFQGALDQLRRLTEQLPGSAELRQTLADGLETFYKRGVDSYYEGNYERAIIALTEVIRIDPTDAYNYCMRGKAYRELGNNDKAEADFARAKQLNIKVQDYTQ